MNKAFLREPEDTGRRYCPACSSLGEQVARETLEAHLAPAAARGLGDPACFCPLATCEVVYFDEYGRRATSADLLAPVYPKDPDAPICACFGLTADDIEQDLAEGGVARVRAAVEQAKSAEAACATKAANGRSCVAAVQKYYFRRRTELTGG